MGIENSMQSILAGSNGKRVVEVTVGGEIVRDIEEPVEAVPGADIHLTIDYRLQMAARAALVEQLRYWNEFYMRERGEVMSTTGTVIGMNPKTGELLFMVSYPNYENNRMTQFIPGDYYTQLSIDENKPLVNKSISSELPPGSVFKMVPALGVLNEDIVTPEQTISCTPTFTIWTKETAIYTLELYRMCSGNIPMMPKTGWCSDWWHRGPCPISGCPRCHLFALTTNDHQLTPLPP